MKKLMVLAAMLAMALMVAAPALAQQTSGAATSGGASLKAGDLANQCAQVANNVNSGNVDQNARANNTQANVGALTAASQNGTAGGGGLLDILNFVLNLLGIDQDVTQTNNATQTNVIAQDGIDQTNNAKLECNQAIEQKK